MRLIPGKCLSDMCSYTYLSCTDPMKEGPSAPSTPVKQHGKVTYTTHGPSVQPIPLFSNLAIEISDDKEEEEVEVKCLCGSPYPPPLSPSGGIACSTADKLGYFKHGTYL
jgi:hypothetical protein